MLYFEDIDIGMRQASPAAYTVTKQEIIEFAQNWDPMPFHIDEAVAAQSPIGKLFASSIHTIALGVKLSHSIQSMDLAVIAGLGWQDVRFPHPVCAGDTLRVETEVLDKRESRSKPDRGIMTTEIRIINQDDILCASYSIINLVFRRPQQ